MNLNMSSIEKYATAGVVTFGANKFIFLADNQISLEDAALLTAANFVGEGYVSPQIVNYLPSMLQHVSGGISTAALYVALQQYKSTSPFQNQIGQFLYAFAVNEVSNNIALPFVGTFTDM